MNKRLRKKLRTAEFTEYGVSVLATASVDGMALMDPFIDFVEANNMGLGGCFDENGKIDVFIIRLFGPRPRTLTEEDRQKISDWLRSQPAIVSFEVGKLVDAHREQ